MNFCRTAYINLSLEIIEKLLILATDAFQNLIFKQMSKKYQIMTISKK
jgi:hypothetical protein